MLSLVYVSYAAKTLTDNDLMEILRKSRENNAKLGVTGMLLYKEGNFMQTLEGEEDVVRNLFAKIKKDPRHRGVLMLLQEKINERKFPDWSMGFHNLNSAEVLQMPGFSHFMNTPLTSAAFSPDLSKCKKLMLLFKQSVR